jgi:ribosomal protein L11
MEDWLLMQGFYHRLTQRNCVQLDATAGGSFMSLTLSRVETLMDKIAENQSWKQDNIQHSRQIEEALEEVCVLSSKMDVLLDWLDQRAKYKKDYQAIQDAFNAQNRCGEYLGIEFLDDPKNANIINNSSTQQKQGLNQHKQSTYQGKYSNKSFNFDSKQPPLRDLILEQTRINDNIVKKLVSNDKILEDINAKLDDFSSAMKDQLNHNKKVETKLEQLAATLPFATNP